MEVELAHPLSQETRDAWFTETASQYADRFREVAGNINWGKFKPDIPWA